MIIIIGGGPAGMMAAIAAASTGKRVTLLEKNDALGRKLLLTGGGRCNFTNACAPEELISHFSATGNFLRDAFKNFGQEALIEFFSKIGLKAKKEADGRVFPFTDKALSVLEVMEKEMEKRNVQVLRKKSVKKLLIDGICIKGVECSDGSVIEAERVIIATGGLSYRTTGSSGDGLKMADKAGHRIVEPSPGLVSLILKGEYSGELEGLSLDGVRLTFRSGKKKLVSKEGSLIFTSNGISGPLTLQSSAKVIVWLDAGKKATAEIDIMPQTEAKEIEDMLLESINTAPKKSLKNSLKAIVPTRLAEVLIKMSDIAPDRKNKQIKAEERKQLAGLLKCLKFEVEKGESFEKAQITRGGVSVKDIDPRTMESKKVSGLYFAGEVIDIDGDSGGFNLQAAFSTGYLAGRSAAFGDQ